VCIKSKNLQPYVCLNPKLCRCGVRGRRWRNNHTNNNNNNNKIISSSSNTNKGWGHGAGGDEMGSCSSGRDAGRRERLAARSAPSSVLLRADSATGARGARGAEAPNEAPLNENEAPHNENEAPHNGIQQAPHHDVEAPHNNNNGIKSDVLIRPLRQLPARYIYVMCM
jgi:hypothetical protein